MHEIPYSIERTRNRHSRAVLKENGILIRLARGLGYTEERQHITELLRRMAKVRAREAERVRIDPFGPLLAGKESVSVHLVTGECITMCAHPGETTKAVRIDGGWLVWRGPNVSDRTFERMLWKLLARSAERSTDALVRSINDETFCVRVKRVSLKYMRSRWGSCSRNGTIALSTPLLCTSPEILRYVIIHELAHRCHPNHSRAFWKHVEQYCPEYKEQVKALRNMRVR